MAYPTPPDHTPSTASTTTELERLSGAFVHVLNERDFDFASTAAQELRSHLSSNFRAHLDTFAQDSRPVTLDEQVAKWRQRAQENPDVNFAILHTMCSVDEAKGRASVYVEMEVSGISNVKLQAVNELNWERVDDA
ncbi:hypothetical protein LTR53_013176 [Teratosphaeriaceae sp. CCFEE 6253]|nr:hypothetical protein LTR53_013176 [Teratosphaeriaceae sp. CCFEE 6253]